MQNTIGDKIYTYEIGDKTYIQRPLVLGQVRQLLVALKGVAIPTNPDAMGLIASLGDALPELLAIVLTEQGQSPQGKNLRLLSEEISFLISPETTLQVIEDFFDCNPIPSLLERIGGMVELMTRKITIIGSMNAASFSAPETLPGATISSGDTPQ